MGKSRQPFRDKQPAVAPTMVSGLIDVGNDGPCFFTVDVDVTAAQLIAGAVTILADSLVPRNCKCYIRDYQIRWGGVAFATATDIRLSDTNAAPVDFVTVLIANTVNIFHRLSASVVAMVGVTQGAALTSQATDGGTVGKGLQIRSTGAAPTAGSTFRVTVSGYFAP